MKKLLLLLLPLSIFAQSFMLSNIPLPKTYIQNLDPYECDEDCMQDYLDNDMIFSFLSHADKKLENKELDEMRVLSTSIFNLGSYTNSGQLKIALLLPYKKIGKYASSTTNTAFAYLITRSHPFMLKSYKIESESTEDIQTALEQIQTDGFEYIIAPFTREGAQNIVSLDPMLNVYFPTINKKDVNSTSPYLTFGAIDRDAQSNLLLKEAVSPLIIFSDKSRTGKYLARHQAAEFKNPTLDTSSSEYSQEMSVYPTKSKYKQNKKVIKYFLSRRVTNLEPYLKENDKIIDGSFFINTPIIKTGMVVSQLTLYDVNATNVLSTQINYDPLLLSMTQYIDRKDMIVANSITQQNNVLIETNSLLGNDIVYDWINYTTTIGVDYFYSILTGEDREYQTQIQENQMVYKIELLRPSYSKFVKFTRN